MVQMLGVLQNAARDDIDVNTDQVYDTLIGTISPLTLWSAVIGESNDIVMDISEFVMFLYFELMVCALVPSGLFLQSGIFLLGWTNPDPYPSTPGFCCI